MKVLQCEMCGSQDLLKHEGVFVCQSCGTKYSVEEAKKMMVEGTVSITGTVSVAGTVRVDKTEELNNLYKLARRAKQADNTDNACKYYSELEMKDPNSWEPYFYLIYFKMRTSKVGDIPEDCKNLSNCFQNVIDMMRDQYGVGTAEFNQALDMMTADVVDGAGIIVSVIKGLGANMQEDYHRYTVCMAEMLEQLGDCCVKLGDQYNKTAFDVWDFAIKGIEHISYGGLFYRELTSGKIYGSKYDINRLVSKILDINYDYKDPTGIANKLRANEKMIVCPICGTKIRESASKCNHCGTSKEKIENLIAEAKAKTEAEAAEARAKAQAEAEERARIRREKCLDWWGKHKNKLWVVIGILLAILLGNVLYEYLRDTTTVRLGGEWIDNPSERSLNMDDYEIPMLEWIIDGQKVGNGRECEVELSFGQHDLLVRSKAIMPVKKSIYIEKGGPYDGTSEMLRIGLLGIESFLKSGIEDQRFRNKAEIKNLRLVLPFYDQKNDVNLLASSYLDDEELVIALSTNDNSLTTLDRVVSDVAIWGDVELMKDNHQRIYKKIPIATIEDYGYTTEYRQAMTDVLEKCERWQTKHGNIVAESARREGRINDPDGYVNVRKRPSASSAIVTTFTEGEVFFYEATSKSWWEVSYSATGPIIGYIHRSRILPK